MVCGHGVHIYIALQCTVCLVHGRGNECSPWALCGEWHGSTLYCTCEWLAHGPVASVSTGHFVCTQLPATIPCDMHETCSLQAFCGSHGQPNRSSKRGNLEEGDKSIHYVYQEK